MIKTNKNALFTGKAMFVAIILLLPMATFFAVADSVNNHDCIFVKYSFEQPLIDEVTIGDTVYDRVTMQGAPGAGALGEPSLPAQGAYILLPQNTKLDMITIMTGEKIALGSGFKVIPVQQPVPLSEIESASLPDADPVYDPEDTYPSTLFTEVGTYTFRGYQILVLMLHPVQYTPDTGELFYYPELQVSVQVLADQNQYPLFRGLEKDKQEVMKKVDNPALADTYTEKNIKPISSEEYDLLIFTNDHLKRTGFEELKNLHDSMGIQTVIKTLTDIGGDTPEDIRDCIRDAYTSWNIEYVLIGGDDDAIPAKDLFVESWPGGYREKDMPSDVYYACLDGTYNFDDDDRWGEPTDGPEGGDVDLMAEVYVGRACVNDRYELAYFINKTIAYIDTENTASYLSEVLLAGEFLWSGPTTWGGDYMDELINGSATHGYATVGIPADTYAITKLYDRDWPGNDWPKSEIINHINNDVYIINHLGHGYNHYGMKMGDADALALINDKHCFVYSQTCLAGHFDGTDCFAEHLNVKTARGAFAVIMNTRYGWGRKGSTDGPSQRFNREFWDAIFGENIKVLSKANQDSKEDNLYRINDPCMRWIYYELTLFGDPTMDRPKPRPIIEMGDITLGFGVTAEIRNIGTAAYIELPWKIAFDQGYGLIFKPENRYKNGIMNQFEAHTETTVETGFVFGFGMVKITVTAGPRTKTAQGFIIGPYIIERDQ
jgi:hypothetical protein